MCRTPSFDALVNESERQHQPTSYQRDLYYHDRNYLEETNPPVFGWMLRDMGTHIFDPRSDSALAMLDAAVKIWPDGMLYWWNGGHVDQDRLQRVSYDELRTLIFTYGG
jgi:hypothetical protein